MSTNAAAAANQRTKDKRVSFPPQPQMTAPYLILMSGQSGIVPRTVELAATFSRDAPVIRHIYGLAWGPQGWPIAQPRADPGSAIASARRAISLASVQVVRDEEPAAGAGATQNCGCPRDTKSLAITTLFWPLPLYGHLAPSQAADAMAHSL